MLKDPCSSKNLGPGDFLDHSLERDLHGVAEESSSLGNSAGKSEARTFVINTEAPEVTLATVKTPSNDTTPSFSGTASESLPVTVRVYKGSKPEGPSPPASKAASPAGTGAQSAPRRPS